MKYRVSYTKVGLDFNALGTMFIEAESQLDVTRLFYPELKARFVADAESCRIVSIADQNEMRIKRNNRRDQRPINLPIEALKRMMDFDKNGFTCFCTHFRPFTKIKIYSGPCLYQYLFLCNSCEQLFSIRYRAVLHFIKGYGVEVANEDDWLIPDHVDLIETMKKECRQV